MENIDLMRTLSVSLIKAQSALKQLMQRELNKRKINITFEMLEVLVCLWKMEGVNQRYLADETAKEKASLTFLINNMEKRGLVIRNQDLTDKRNKLICLTQHGKQIRASILPIVEVMHKKLASKFSEKQVINSISCLEKLRDTFNNI